MLSKSATIQSQFESENGFFVANRVNVSKYFGTMSDPLIKSPVALLTLSRRLELSMSRGNFGH
jgi:hypothetical protein